MYNPARHMERFDPDGRYVREYVSELRDVFDRWLREPWEMPADVQAEAVRVIGRDYPEPIVDRQRAREAAKERYREAGGREPAGAVGSMRHTRSIATHGSPSHGREPRLGGGHGEQVTGSLESLSGGSDQNALIAQVREVAFPIALRGYEREAVDEYVKRVNALITDLESSRSPEAAIRRALDQVGEETSSILQRAQQTASEITERSRASADDRIREAEREARALTEDSEDRVRELEADYGEIWSRRDRLLDQVRDLAERLLATADDAGERFPTQADEVGAGTARADTDSFPELRPADEDTTARSPFATEGGADLEPAGEDSSGPATGAGEESLARDLVPGGDRAAEDETVQFGASPASSGLEPEGQPHHDTMSPGDEMDFADSPGGDSEPGFGDRPAGDSRAS